MYKIIGGDQREYGPITAEQLRQWIAEGRANAQSKIQSEGSGEWKPLGEFAEFAAALGANNPPPMPPPNLAALDAERVAGEVLARNFNLDIGSCVGRSWDLLKRHFWLAVGTTLLVGVVASAVPFIGTVLQGGLLLFFLKLIRRERAEVGDAFAGFSIAFLHLFLAGLVIGVLVALGMFCCLLPGIYLAVAWTFAVPLIIDKRMDFWPAMELSRKVASRHWWSLFGLVVLNMFIILAGCLACGVGVFVAAPIAAGSLAYAYEDIFGSAAAPSSAVSLDPLLPVGPAAGPGTPGQA